MPMKIQWHMSGDVVQMAFSQAFSQRPATGWVLLVGSWLCPDVMDVDDFDDIRRKPV